MRSLKGLWKQTERRVHAAKAVNARGTGARFALAYPAKPKEQPRKENAIDSFIWHIPIDALFVSDTSPAKGVKMVEIF